MNDPLNMAKKERTDVNWTRSVPWDYKNPGQKVYIQDFDSYSNRHRAVYLPMLTLLIVSNLEREDETCAFQEIESPEKAEKILVENYGKQ